MGIKKPLISYKDKRLKTILSVKNLHERKSHVLAYLDMNTQKEDSDSLILDSALSRENH